MEINIKTIQLTKLDAALNVDADAIPLQEQLSLDILQQVTVIELDGEVNYNTAPLVEAQLLPLAQPKAKLLLDMTKVPYLSSAGLRMLLSLYRQVTNQDGQVVLVGLVEEIKDTMAITGFLDFFKNCDTLDSGLAALNQPMLLPT